MNSKWLVPAEPEDLEIVRDQAVLIVVDMQNAFLSKGGTLDLAGMNTEAGRDIVKPCKDIIEAFRTWGCRIIYLRHGYQADLSDSGGEDSPNPRKELALLLMNKCSQYQGKLLIRGSWDAEIIEELAPRPEDLVVWKQKYSGFIGTNLDLILRTQGAKYLFFCGVATNVCVEATLRDAFSHEYFPILVSDAVASAGPAVTQEATIFNIRNFYGWTTTSRLITEANRSAG